MKESEDNSVILEILNKFCAKDTKYSGNMWMENIFNFNGKTFSTNSFILIASNKYLGDYPENGKIQSIYPKAYNINKEISISEIKDKLNLFPMVDCYDTIESKCKACYGDGEVEFSFSFDSKTYDIYNECPVCNGDGLSFQKSMEPNGRKEIDKSFYFKIGYCDFKAEIINDIIYIAEKMKCNNIQLVSQSKNSLISVFTIGGIEVMVASLQNTEKENIAQEIPL